MNRKIGKALVVGAGIAGIRSALDLAEFGYGVTLIDRSPHLGGILSQLDYQFPTNRCGMCKMLPMVNRDAGSQYCLRKGLFHENIEILLSTEIASIEGEAGHFQVMLHQQQAGIDPQRCIGCGECARVCPVETPDEFNAGLSKRKAIYLPVPHAIPNTYVIDHVACNRCGACVEVCPNQAIELPEQDRQQFHILVVDDERIVRDSLKEWLEEEGFSVDTAASGPEALDQLKTQSYQVMLVDIKMPGMDGVEVLQKAKDFFPDLNVIMMTAYATVETAVEAMKIGALDYLIKPFDPESMIPMILKIFQDATTAKGQALEVGAIVASGGTDFFNPASGKDTFGYNVFPNVVTSLEFERLFSGTGPNPGRLLRPLDGKAISNVAWLQCVGSRDIQLKADFCSSTCCMYAIKEALIAKEKTNEDFEATIFYMDMRTFGKSFQRYREDAESTYGVRFERGRVHSITQNPENGDVMIRWADLAGRPAESAFDLAVLSVGQRPVQDMPKLAETLGMELNAWGFGQTAPFSLTQSNREGISLGGTFSGPTDISDTLTRASAAALDASRIIHSSGGGLDLARSSTTPMRDLTRDIPSALVVICACGQKLKERIDPAEIVRQLQTDPIVKQVEFLEETCTDMGWQRVAEMMKTTDANRLLIGACMPYAFQSKLRELGEQAGIPFALMEVVDVFAEYRRQDTEANSKQNPLQQALSILRAGIARLKWVSPDPTHTVRITQKALVVGGGVAGMTAALAIADHGFQVDLVEQTDQLGGNLKWLRYTLEGDEAAPFREDICQRTQQHPKITVHLQSHVVSSAGQVGNFLTMVEEPEHAVQALEHGVTVLATGGTEATTHAYGYGSDPSVVTQKELEEKLTADEIDPGALTSVVMIQCVDSREEPRNYCSRVCCANALKQALKLKQQNPDLSIYILYRDIMTYGFSESYYTQARKAGVIFIAYQVNNKPVVQSEDGSVSVTVYEPIIGKPVQIGADLVVLATGVVPTLPEQLAQSFGAGIDQDGFFQEAESKWRPVDSLKEGIFACGLAHSPRNIPEAVATAQAAAMRALRILSRDNLKSGKVVASVHTSLCSLCERCIEACPYGARMLSVDRDSILINSAMCQGCGSCAAVCPNGASVLEGFQTQQMLEVIDVAIG